MQISANSGPYQPDNSSSLNQSSGIGSAGSADLVAVLEITQKGIAYAAREELAPLYEKSNRLFRITRPDEAAGESTLMPHENVGVVVTEIWERAVAGMSGNLPDGERTLFKIAASLQLSAERQIQFSGLRFYEMAHDYQNRPELQSAISSTLITAMEKIGYPLTLTAT